MGTMTWYPVQSEAWELLRTSLRPELPNISTLITNPVVTAGCYGNGQWWTDAGAGVSPGRFVESRQHGGVRRLRVRDWGLPAPPYEGGPPQVQETVSGPRHPATILQSLRGHLDLLTRGGSFRLLYQEAKSVPCRRSRRRRSPIQVLQPPEAALTPGVTELSLTNITPPPSHSRPLILQTSSLSSDSLTPPPPPPSDRRPPPPSYEAAMASKPVSPRVAVSTTSPTFMTLTTRPSPTTKAGSEYSVSLLTSSPTNKTDSTARPSVICTGPSAVKKEEAGLPVNNLFKKEENKENKESSSESQSNRKREVTIVEGKCKHW